MLGCWRYWRRWGGREWGSGWTVGEAPRRGRRGLWSGSLEKRISSGLAAPRKMSTLAGGPLFFEVEGRLGPGGFREVGL